MKKFSQYATNNPTEEIPKGYTQEDDVTRLTKQILEAYDGKPSVEMLKSILKQAEESKRNGTLTNEEIDEFYSQFAPLLDAKQQKMLQSVVQKLKKI